MGGSQLSPPGGCRGDLSRCAGVDLEIKEVGWGRGGGGGDGCVCNVQ